MRRDVHDLSRWPTFDEPAGVHHKGPVGKVASRSNVMRDIQQRQATLLDKLAEQVEDPEPTGHVEHGNRFIGE